MSFNEQGLPSKPLKILTLDGGGLQAISTLLILNELLEQICTKDGVSHRKPRPCEIFDTIAGIGAGGWLAILLGRFRMDITSCLSEWYRITRNLPPRSRAEKFRLRFLRHHYFSQERLVEQVDHLTQAYNVGENLFEPAPEGARTRHVFVAALENDTKRYKLFRTYDLPNTAKTKDGFREGPKDPANFKITSAFGTTGAARYFTGPWTVQMADSGRIKLRDTKFPKPHNITKLALEEMWALYGKDVRISVVVNIGPGMPDEKDVSQLARRFSWGPNAHDKRSSIASVSSRFQARMERVHRPRQSSPLRYSGVPNEQVEASPPSREGAISLQPSNPETEVLSEKQSDKQSPEPIGLPDLCQKKDRDNKLTRLEDQIETDNKELLRNYEDQIYYRLALAISPKGTSQNDSSASDVAHDATLLFIERSQPVINKVVGLIYQTMTEAAPAA